MSCPFCNADESRLIAKNGLAIAILDGFPVNPGHALIIPKRHVASWFHASSEERLAIMDLMDQVKALLDRDHRPDGYNLGINTGAAAGQTVMHLHVHLIPRYKGDVDDLRGGIRKLFPDRARYWEEDGPR
ncbi:MAG: HIT family protein [Deltaproteobacteria bacterium]|nr:HIT family protein [Deltaproteobacteria bacterium]